MDTCPNCGAPLENDICPYCGTIYTESNHAQPQSAYEDSDQDQWQPKSAYDTSSYAGAPSEQADQTSTTYVYAEQPTSSEQGTKGHPVNKVAYCLLCLFLGAFGIHKFYSGMIGKGVLYAVFCWTGVPLIIALVEFFIALFKHADAQGKIHFG